MDRIPFEHFANGKAIWSGGKPYLKEHAMRLGLRPDAKAPAEYERMMGAEPPPPPPPPKPVEVFKAAIPAPVKPPPSVEPLNPLQLLATPAPVMGKNTAPGNSPTLPSTLPPLASKIVVPGKNRDDAFLKKSDVVPNAPKIAPPERAPSAPVQNAPARALDATPPPGAMVKPPSSQHMPKPGAKPESLTPRAANWIKPGDTADTANDDEPTITGVRVPRPGDPPLTTKAQTPSLPIFKQPESLNKPTPPPNNAMAPQRQQDVLVAAIAKIAAAEKAAAPKPSEKVTLAKVPAPVTPVPDAKPPVNPTITMAPAPLVAANPVVAKIPEPPAPAIPAKAVQPVEAASPIAVAAAAPAKPIPGPVPPKPPTVVVAPTLKSPVPIDAPVAKVPAPVVAAPAAKIPVPATPKAAAVGAAKTTSEEDDKFIPLEPGRALDLEEMKKLEILEGIPDAVIKRLYGGIVEREFKKGDLICRQGDYASTAFYIVSGTVEIYITTPDRAAMAPLRNRKPDDGGSLKDRFLSWVQGRKEGSRKSKSGKRPNIENVPSLPPGLTPIEMGKGELFGEMSCINFYPRSANVRAKEDVVVIELIRTVLDSVRTRKSKYKEKLDRNYRDRSLAEHLNSVPLFKDLDKEFIDELRKYVVLRDFEPGEVIFSQHAVADAFYLIRHGCVKVSQTQPGGELVLTYLGQNDAFGEIGLIRGDKRSATCTALNHVEIVKIEKKYFDILIHCYDEFKSRMVRTVDERIANARSTAERPPTRPLGEFIDHELMQAQHILLLDLEKCTRCDECVKACVDSHDDGKTRLMREGLRFDKFLLATSCRSCMDPVCMVGCPVGSIRREATFEIIIEDWCIGCEKCANQCPYGNITMHEFPLSKEELARKEKEEEEAQRKKAAAAAAKPAAPGKKAEAEPLREKEVLKTAAVKKLAVTCDQCSTLQEPSCVYACPHDAAMRVNARDFFEIVGKSTLKEAAKSEKRD